MHRAEEKFIEVLQRSGVDLVCSLPCDRIKRLISIIPYLKESSSFYHIPLTREEEGVGICAGAALAGRRPAMLLQNSGIGNMINALLSLTGFYRLPLALFLSHRGVYKEKIAAQMPMGERLPGILKGAGIGFSLINDRADIDSIGKKLDDVYAKNKMHAFLLSPKIWETSASCAEPAAVKRVLSARRCGGAANVGVRMLKPVLTRYEALEVLSPCLDGRLVVCNLGIPAKELFHIKHQLSNFYMLGSMGMATPIGIGVAVSHDKEVVVIDGDGSLLMNPGSLATAAYCSPEKLTIVAIDNASYGSTGNQPTLTGQCVDLELVARGFGIKNTCKVAGKKQLSDAMKEMSAGLRFIHCLTLAGNRDVPDIPLHHLEIKKQVQNFIRSA